MPKLQKTNHMLSRFIATPDLFDHLYLGIPARQYHRLKIAVLASGLDVIMTKLDPNKLSEQIAGPIQSKFTEGPSSC